MPNKMPSTPLLAGHPIWRSIAGWLHPRRSLIATMLSVVVLGDLATAAQVGEPDPVAASKPPVDVETHSAAEWVAIALRETKQQKEWEAAHPQDSALFLGAGQFVTWNYGGPCTNPNWVVGTPEFITWWKTTGAAGLEQWATEDFPVIIDRDHLIYSALALSTAQNTPRDSKALYVNGYPFSDPKKLWAYLDRIKQSGSDAYRRGLAGQGLSRQDFQILRLYAALMYSMVQGGYLPCELRMTAGDINHSPLPGMAAPDFTLPRLESILQRPGYSDAYSFDFQRPFHSEVATFLLQVCNGYEAIPSEKRTTGGPSIAAKPYRSDYQDSVTLSNSRGKKPVLLIFADGIDGYWLTSVGYLEPLYQATKDQIDWYLISDDINDNVFWADYYFQPSQAQNVAFQKALSMEDRGQTAKMLSMRYVNLSFPILLDDMEQRTQNAYTDSGGITKVVLIDKNGIISFNNRLQDMPDKYYADNGQPWGYVQLVENHCLTTANVAALLENHGVWNRKDAVVPNWQPPACLEKVMITKLDASAGTMTVPGPDGKDLVAAVDKGTRIVFNGTPNGWFSPVIKSFGDLAVGMQVSFSYEADASAVGRTTRLIVSGNTLNDYVTNCVTTDKLWCPAVATGISESEITAVPVTRPRSEIRGLTFWEQAGDKAKPESHGWMIPMVKDWADHPDQKLTFHVDRATEVIVNGMKAKVSDIHVGDHLGVECRPDQRPDDRRPFFIFVYRRP